MSYRTLSLVSLTFLMLTGCAAEPPIPASQNFHEFQLRGCPASIRVSLPEGFSRATSSEELAPKKSNRECRYDWNQPTPYECLFKDWSPETSFPRMEIGISTSLTYHLEPGQLDPTTWSTIRDSLNHSYMASARDKRVIEGIRKMEASSPSSDRQLRSRFGEFFESPGNATMAGYSQWGKESGHLAAERHYYAQGCVISVRFFTPFPAEKPISILNDFYKAVIVR